jgi:hypothetical protein
MEVGLKYGSSNLTQLHSNHLLLAKNRLKISYERVHHIVYVDQKRARVEASRSIST